MWTYTVIKLRLEQQPQQQQASDSCAPTFLCASPVQVWTLAGSPRGVLLSDAESDGSAPWLRHERMTVAMALAEKLHHFSRGQKMARAGEGISRCTSRPRSGRISLPRRQAPCALPWTWMTCLPPGARPDRPQERVQRRTVGRIILAPMLDVPVPLMEEQLLVHAFAPHDIHVTKQVIEVPKILIDELSVRTPVREPQLAEQLVEVPTIISFSPLQRIKEQNVDIPVHGGGLQGSRPGTGFNSVFVILSFALHLIGSTLRMRRFKGFFRTFSRAVQPVRAQSLLRLRGVPELLALGIWTLFSRAPSS